MISDLRQPDGLRGLGPHRGFTVVELLVVTALIALLVSLVVVALGRARAGGERASTRNLLRTVALGIEGFRSDFGYYPPLLDDDLEVAEDEDELEDVDYWSALTLTSYLVGVNDLNRNGEFGARSGDDFDDGVAGPGFRDPGPDRAWGGADDADLREQYWQRRAAFNDGELTGPTYDPYIELGDGDLIDVYRDRGGQEVEGQFEIRDVWGNAVRYYRAWPGNRYWPGNEADLPPDYEESLWPREWFGRASLEEFENEKPVLRAAPFVLFSPGRDLETDPDDFAADVNDDNLVEIATP